MKSSGSPSCPSVLSMGSLYNLFCELSTKGGVSHLLRCLKCEERRAGEYEQKEDAHQAVLGGKYFQGANI